LRLVEVTQQLIVELSRQCNAPAVEATPSRCHCNELTATIHRITHSADSAPRFEFVDHVHHDACGDPERVGHLELVKRGFAKYIEHSAVPRPQPKCLEARSEAEGDQLPGLAEPKGRGVAQRSVFDTAHAGMLPSP